MLHRENGPAIVDIDNYKAWYIDGKKHRLDGPAVINGKSEEWWIKDVHLSAEEVKILRFSNELQKELSIAGHNKKKLKL
jgi:hypothetical protein